MDVAREEVARCGKAPGCLWAADFPFADGVCERIGRSRQRGSVGSNHRVVRVGDLGGSVLTLRDLHHHVRLARAEPNFPDQDILHDDLVLAGDGQIIWSAGRYGFETCHPPAVLTRLCLLYTSPSP